MKLLLAGICLFFLVFATLRASRVPLTYDEAASYIRYIDTSVRSPFDTGPLSIFNFEVATNHFLNTVSTRGCYLIAGGSELVLRLPNLIGYAMFMGFSLLILTRWARLLVAIPGFLLLNLNPYVLDFFTLSRGYGMSLGFLMGSLHYVLRGVEQLRVGQGARRDTSLAFVFAGAAVMANFALLNVYVSIFGVLLLAHVLSNTAPGIPNPGSRIPTRSARSFALLALVATVFAALVFSQDAGLSATLYEPVVVTIAGLQPAQRHRASVIRVDLRGRDVRLGFDAGLARWRGPDGVAYRALRIELPVEDAESLERIDVAIGSRLFSVDPRRGRMWMVHDDNATRIFESDESLALLRSRFKRFRAVMNWAGDSRYLAHLAIATAWTLVALAALGAVLTLAGSIANRMNVLTADQWRPFEFAALWIAALAGPPVYLLRRNSELYFGGTRGLVADTFLSTIESSFYGRTYHPSQARIVFACILITVVMFLVVLFVGIRRHTVQRVVPALTVLAIIVLTSLTLVVQRTVFDTVYLTGRTALFYIPLYVMFATLLCDAVAGFGRIGKAVAAGLLTAALFGSAYHFTATANTRYAWDWRDDASTRLMFDDLEQILESASNRRLPVILGVHSDYIPVAEYYARRRSADNIHVVALAPRQRPDYEYLADGNLSAANVVRRYPSTRTVLVRVRAFP